jgi:hypothetical protein
MYLFCTATRPATGPTLPPIQYVKGAIFLVARRPRREANHSRPYNAGFQKIWNIYMNPHGVAFDYADPELEHYSKIVPFALK